ncbi:MAG: ribonuclease Y [Patescibacteria group bacterium]|nr:ribonuclease Y [Patescibacteria group bacterium]
MQGGFMFDVLKTLSGLVKTRRTVPKKQQKISQSASSSHSDDAPTLSVDIEAEIKIAQAKAKEIIIEAKDEAIRIRREAEEEARRKLEHVDRREGALEEREKRLQLREGEIEQIRKEIEKIKEEQIAKLERVANLTRDEARDLIMSAVRTKLKEEIAKEIREAVEQARNQAEEKAREILVDAMKHGATDYVPEYTVSVVKVPDEDVKGRIIGKEGRNIRTFETATGVDVDLDEEGVIRLSSFDPVRREIARVSLERLMKDGRIQPARIEEIVEHVKKDIDRIMFEEGQKLCHAVGVYNLPAPIVALLGRFKYRYSYGQNMIAHTLEETKIGIAIAHEVGADVNVVRLGCLLHDIGKVIMDKEGNHIELGVELLKKYNIPQKVIDCVAQHHEDTPFTSIESMIVYISDAISGSRPGARYENYDEYVKRRKDLEEIATSHEGVKEVVAYQAGRELRIAVDPGIVDDATATIMAHEIKEEIEKKVTYPGSIKITIIRELRVTETAK